MHLIQFLKEVKELGLTTYQYNKIAALALQIDLYAKKAPAFDMYDDANEIIQAKNVTMEDLRSSSRKQNLVEARALLVRTIIQKNPSANVNEIGQLINRDRSSVYNLAYKTKVPCEIAPLKMYIRNYRMITHNPRKNVAIHRLQKTKAA